MADDRERREREQRERFDNERRDIERKHREDRGWPTQDERGKVEKTTDYHKPPKPRPKE